MTCTRSVRVLFGLAVAAASAAVLATSPAVAQSTGTVPTAAGAAAPAPPSRAEVARLRARAQHVEILRDRWGIAHVRGRTDADAVFGMVFAQAEDDFRRVERNYLVALGRLAEVEGERALWTDLRQRLFIDHDTLRVLYAGSPAWLKALMDAWADGLNWYLHTHPTVTPRGIVRYEPWMALSFTEGSIGGDIEGIATRGIAEFYGGPAGSAAPGEGAELASAAGVPHDDPYATMVGEEPMGSNGFAIAPRLSASGHAMLMINPHTSFYFRPEIHVTSDEGINAYGAVTWGQFFIYQGFNDRLGWMHTSGGGDVVDEWLETVEQRDGRWMYRVGREWRPLATRRVVVRVAGPAGATERAFTTYVTHRGPVIRSQDGKWVSVGLMNRPVDALTQSYQRTTARDFAAFERVMGLRTNSSNNTVYADADGRTALWYGNFVPRRDPRHDYTRPLDGTDPTTDWQGLHEVGELIRVVDPRSGWIQNTNNWPFSAAGPYSPRVNDYPAYMWSDPENARGVHAVQVFSGAMGLTLDGLIAKGYDPHLTAFDVLLPALFRDYDALASDDPRRAALREPVVLLRAWDRRTAVTSEATTLAVFWGTALRPLMGPVAAMRAGGMPSVDFMARLGPPGARLEALERAVAKLTADFGSWRTPWGEVNRYQRLTGDVALKFDDALPSTPVPFTASDWGALAAFRPAPNTGTRRLYGQHGNSFVAVVEFGPRVRAKSILAGGVSGDPSSPHFADQVEGYAAGRFKDVLFHREDVERGAVRRYRPGR